MSRERITLEVVPSTFRKSGNDENALLFAHRSVKPLEPPAPYPAKASDRADGAESRAQELADHLRIADATIEQTPDQRIASGSRVASRT
jgi:hypothetical protein